MRRNTKPINPITKDTGINKRSCVTSAGSAVPRVSQLRVTSISGLIGFHRISVAARPSPSAKGNMTGVVYIRKGMPIPMARPKSEYSEPIGTQNNPMDAPKSMVLKSPKGTSRIVHDKTSSDQKIIKIATIRKDFRARSNKIVASALAIKASGGTFNFINTPLPLSKPVSGALKAEVNVLQIICPISTKAG